MDGKYLRQWIGEKLGIEKADDVMQCYHIEWTEFFVQKKMPDAVRCGICSRQTRSCTVFVDIGCGHVRKLQPPGAITYRIER